jgi:hypothetical protein
VSKAPKARFSSGKRMRIDTNGRIPAPAGYGDTSRIIQTGDPTKEAVPVRIARNIAGFTFLLGVLGVLVYAVLAVTVLVVMPADGQKALVLRGAFPVGQAPSGAYAYVSADPVDYSFTGKVAQATTGVKSGSVVQIVAGPTASITTDDRGFIVADGKRTDFQGQVTARELRREYVAICVAGWCDPGKTVLIPQDNIVGGVKGFVGLGGITEPTTPGQK